MSTDTQQLNNQESSAQTPIILEAGQRVTAKIKDIQSFIEPVNVLLKPEKRLTNVVSLSEITQALIPANLNLKDEVIELNPKVGEAVSTIVELDENSEYIGFNSITVRTKPLENRIVPLLTPAMLNTEGGLTITKTSDDFCGMNQVEIQDIALASNIEYTIVPSDLENTDTIELDFLSFDKFSDEIKKQYKDKVFGAKDLTVNVPLVEEHTFVVDKNNLGKTFVPADVPSDFDGTGGSEGKLGFKKITLKAKLADTLEVSKSTLSTNKVKSLSPGNGALGYTAVQIPEATNITLDVSSQIGNSTSYQYSWDNLSSMNKLSSNCVGVYSVDLTVSTEASFVADSVIYLPYIISSLQNSQNSSIPSLIFDKGDQGIWTINDTSYNSDIYLNHKLLKSLTVPLPQVFKYYSGYDWFYNIETSYYNSSFHRLTDSYSFNLSQINYNPDFLVSDLSIDLPFISESHFCIQDAWLSSMPTDIKPAYFKLGADFIGKSMMIYPTSSNVSAYYNNNMASTLYNPCFGELEIKVTTGFIGLLCITNMLYDSSIQVFPTGLPLENLVVNETTYNTTLVGAKDYDNEVLFSIQISLSSSDYSSKSFYLKMISDPYYLNISESCSISCEKIDKSISSTAVIKVLKSGKIETNTTNCYSSISKDSFTLTDFSNSQLFFILSSY